MPPLRARTPGPHQQTEPPQTPPPCSFRRTPTAPRLEPERRRHAAPRRSPHQVTVSEGQRRRFRGRCRIAAGHPSPPRCCRRCPAAAAVVTRPGWLRRPGWPGVGLILLMAAELAARGRALQRQTRRLRQQPRHHRRSAPASSQQQRHPGRAPPLAARRRRTASWRSSTPARMLRVPRRCLHRLAPQRLPAASRRRSPRRTMQDPRPRLARQRGW